MSVARPRMIALIATALSAVVSLAAVALTVRLCMPLDPWVPPSIELRANRPVVSQIQPAYELADLAVIWQRDLRQPVIDAPDKEPPARKLEPKLAIRLVGTAIENKRQFGVFQLSDSRTVVRPVGQDVEGYRIVEIGRGRARLRSGEREYDLKVPWYDRIAARGRE